MNHVLHSLCLALRLALVALMLAAMPALAQEDIAWKLWSKVVSILKF
jgi:hypothetical protein